MRAYQAIAIIGVIMLATAAGGLAGGEGSSGDAIAAPSGGLAEAVADGDERRARELVAAGADLNATDERGLPLLQQAMRRQDRRAFRLLLDLGADPARGSRDGQTAMHLAVMGKDRFWLEQLLERGANPDLPNTITGAPPLFDALRARLPRNVDRLLAAGAGLDVRDRNGTTPLHQAALVNDPASVLKFLEAGADARATDRTGATFQDYLYDGDPKLLNIAARRNLERIEAWLAAHHGTAHPAPEAALRIGPTGIYCVKAPCPWRGITRLGADGRPEGRPLWTDDELPAVVASEGDRRRIAAAWRDGGCLVVRGRLEAATLRVRGISGGC